MEARFFCKTGALAGADYRIAGSATIGRGASNTIVVGDGVVSKAHARIAFDPAGAAWVLEDLGSTNGTRLDGVPVSGRERMRDLHVVTLGGRHDFIFVVPAAEAAEAASADSPPVEAGTRHDRPAALSAPPLVAESSPGSGDPAGNSPSPSGDSPAAGMGTRHDRPAALSVPPLVAESPPGSGDSVPSEGSAAVGAGTRHDRPAALSAPPLVAESSPGPGDSVPSEDFAAVGAGTRHDRPAALSVPPLVAESSPGSGDSASSEDSPAVEPGTRHDRPAALSVPPLVAGAAAPGAGAGGRAEVGDPRSPAASPSDGPPADVSSSTRHEAPPVLSAPPLAVGDPASPAAGSPRSAESASDSAKGAADPAAGAAAETPADGVSFQVRPADGAPRRVTLGDGRHVFGRAKDCAVAIDDRTLSRRHAAFTVADGRVSVEDLGSLNGTFVGGVRIEEATEVGDGRVVGLGEQVKVLVGGAGS